MSEQTEAQPARGAAWQEALNLHAKWEEAIRRASGGPGGGGYRDPHAATEALFAWTRLAAVVAEHGFEGTRADPNSDASWVETQSASWECPPTEVRAQ